MASSDPHSSWRQSSEPAATPTLELGASGIGCHTPPKIGSPTSSQGSWVVDPDEGWDGQGAGPTHTISLQAPFQQQQEQQQQHQEQQSQVSPRSSPTSSPLRSWARVPRSPPAAEYPAIGSPPSSPGGSVRSANSSSAGRAAGDGLVALARDEICDDDVIFMDTADALNAHRSVALPAGEDRNSGTSEGGRFDEQEEAVVGCTAIDDVDMLDVAAGDSDEEPFVIAVGMTAEEAVEAIAEEAELGATEPPSVSLGCVAVSPPRRVTRASSFEHAYGYPRQGAATLPAGATPPRNAPSPVGAGVVAEVDMSPSGHSTMAETGSRTSPLREPLLPMPACVPLDGTVDGNYDGIALGAGDVDDKYDGKQLDRLWRWTGLITAAKMGVIPIIVCATVAALSTQTSGGSGDRGGRTSGGGAGGGGGGGGGGTRCSSRRPRPLGGGGGTGCFPDVRADRSSYGCMPMPYCVAPSVVCA